VKIEHALEEGGVQTLSAMEMLWLTVGHRPVGRRDVDVGKVDPPMTLMRLAERSLRRPLMRGENN